MCEGCGRFGLRLDVHHRQARQMGGVSGEAEHVSADTGNLLALCRICHDETEHAETWDLTQAIGWKIPRWVPDPLVVPALIYTVNGYAWWQLTTDAGFQWIDFRPDQRISYGASGSAWTMTASTAVDLTGRSTAT
jgi:hypothetical protein